MDDRHNSIMEAWGLLAVPVSLALSCWINLAHRWPAAQETAAPRTDRDWGLFASCYVSG